MALGITGSREGGEASLPRSRAPALRPGSNADAASRRDVGRIHSRRPGAAALQSSSVVEPAEDVDPAAWYVPIAERWPRSDAAHFR